MIHSIAICLVSNCVIPEFHVIPANAGIQRKIILSKLTFIGWIPASAGMTNKCARMN